MFKQCLTMLHNGPKMMLMRTPNSPCIAVAYIRVSTDDQHLGPEAQRASIEAWATREGVEVVAWYADQGVSGATPIEQRPALVAALTGLRERHAGLLLVAKRDRVARDVLVALMVERAVKGARARLVSVDGVGNGDGPADEFMRTVVDGAAAYERALIRVRTKVALLAKRARGERAGGVPYGYHLAADGVRLEVDAAEQAVLGVVSTLRQGGMSHRRIVHELAARGLVSRAGQRFGQTQVARMLTRRAA